MSMAGVHSNRGDGYQTLIAFEWALTVLSDPDFQWIQIDSLEYSVDDIVVGKSDGTIICCQCKKNQPDFKAWTLNGLNDELVKAHSLLASNKNAEVHFYSRSPFGALAQLREHSATQDNESGYYENVGKMQKTTDAKLAKLFSTQVLQLSTYQFLRRITFNVSPELDRMEVLLKERLRYMSYNPKIAYNALWKHLDQLGARMTFSNVSIQYRLTKNELRNVLYEAGAMLIPIMSFAEVRASFASVSIIGRRWCRDIAGQRISRPILNEILAAIDARKRPILIHGSSGSGKTCVMLALQDALEKRAQTSTDMVPIFI